MAAVNKMLPIAGQKWLAIPSSAVTQATGLRMAHLFIAASGHGL
jgi:hypothetical protein